MRLYHAMSGNTKRVRIFLAEKQIEIPRVELTLGTDTRTAAYRRINSLGEVPALQLDDGQVITESRAICRYLDLAFPDIPLMGITAEEQGRIAMWSDRIHGHLFMAYGSMVRHRMPLFADVVEQVPTFAETQERLIPQKWAWLDEMLSDASPFIAGEQFSFADVEGMTVLMLAEATALDVPKTCPNARRWADAMRRRPSWVA